MSSIIPVRRNVLHRVPATVVTGNAVTFDAVGTALHTSGTQANYNAQITVGTGTNRALIVVVCNASGVSGTTPTANWDTAGTNQPMVLLINQDAGGGRQVFVFGLRNPTSGSKNLVVQWGGSLEIVMNAVAFTHVNPANDAAAFPNWAGVSSGGTPDSITITSGLNNYAIAGFVSSANFTSVSDSQLLLDNTGGLWATGSNYKQATGATDTLTGSPGNATSTIVGGAIAHD